MDARCTPGLRSEKAGKWGEDVATAHLTAQGYAILERNWRMGHLELDIVAQKGATIAFVEVKTRQSLDADPVAAVNKRKRARVITAADVYLRRYSLPFEYRFDIITVTGTPQSHIVEHIPDAFMPGLKRIR